MSSKKPTADAQNLLRAFQRSGDVQRGTLPASVEKLEPGRKVNVALEEGLHLEIKLLATQRRMTVQALVNAALRGYIEGIKTDQ